MFSFLTSWRNRFKGAPDQATPASLPSDLRFAIQFNQRPGLALILGDACVGKSTLMRGAARQLQGCVVHIQLTTQTLNGWEDAPFYGLLTPDNEATRMDDLPDVLRGRRPGYFLLEMPEKVLTGDCDLAQRVRTRLGELLRQPLMDSVPHSQSFRLVLLVDNAEQVLCDKALNDILRYGRSANCHLVMAVQSTRLFNERFQEDVKHLVAFKSTDSRASAVERMFEDSRVELASLQRGRFWHKVVPTAEVQLLELPLTVQSS